MENKTARTNSNIEIVNPPGIVMMDAVDIERIPWIEAPLLPGLEIKYVHVDLTRGVSVLLMRFGKDVQFPVHAHFGTSMLFVLKGEFSYLPAGKIGPGGFGYEPFGVVHEPEATIEDETLMWVINTHNECVQFYEEDGSLGTMTHLATNLVRAREVYGDKVVRHLNIPDYFWKGIKR